MSTNLLFVYGTLRKLDANTLHPLLADCQYLGVGYLQAQLYATAAGYPGVLLSTHPEHQVIGEIYRIFDRVRLFAQLDDYEECSTSFPEPHEYQRLQVPITNGCGQTLTAWCYVYNYAVSNLRLITTGDYTHA